MSKKSKQIFYLILSVISLVYLILSYCGVFRYFGLHYFSIEKYIKNYQDLPKADKQRVIVSFQYESDKNLKTFINSILDQTVKVDDIGVTIPQNMLKNIPENMKKVLSTYSYDKDYDNAGNLVCSILREPESNTKIILVDPTIVYGEDFIEKMVEGSNKNPDKIIYAKQNNPKWGVLIKPKFFDDKISDYKKGKGCCPWMEECCKVKSFCINY